MSDDTQNTFDSLKKRFSDLDDGINLQSISREINSISESITKLPSEIKSIRDRGYVFSAFLEQKAEVIQKHWDEIRKRVTSSLDKESFSLRSSFKDVQQEMERADNVAANPAKLAFVLSPLEEGIKAIEERIENATERISEMYESLQTDISGTESQLYKIRWYCEQKEEASFDFLANESFFLVAQAEWKATGKGKQDPDGVLFLTDQRLIFEQKEKTGKRLGMFGGKMEQEVEWEIPLNKIESVESEKKGMLGGIDLLHFKLGSGAPYSDITVEVKGGVDCKFWAKQIERMIAGETNDERAIEPDPEMLEAIRNAPTECHICGATLPKLVANQTQIDCEYCGSVIRI